VRNLIGCHDVAGEVLRDLALGGGGQPRDDEPRARHPRRVGRGSPRDRRTHQRRGARDSELDALRRELAAKTVECTVLRRQLDAAATTIAALYHDNVALHDEAAGHGGATVLALPAPNQTRERPRKW
jgi:hypothetical protein